MKRRSLVTMLAVVAMLMGAIAPASAGGVTAQKLDDSGWGGNLDGSCLLVGVGTHCISPSQGSGKAIQVMVFSPDGDTFFGTEILRASSKDISGKPCGKGSTWTLVPDLGLYACHHWVGGSAPAS